jgi:hypothetical protein
MLKTHAFLPIVGKCHENVEEFSQSGGRIGACKMFSTPVDAKPVVRRDKDDDGMVYRLNGLPLSRFFQCTFMAHCSPNM